MPHPRLERVDTKQRKGFLENFLAVELCTRIGVTFWDSVSHFDFVCKYQDEQNTTYFLENEISMSQNANKCQFSKVKMAQLGT